MGASNSSELVQVAQQGDSLQCFTKSLEQKDIALSSLV